MAAAAFAVMKNVIPKDFSKYSHLNRCEKEKKKKKTFVLHFCFLFFNVKTFLGLL